MSIIPVLLHFSYLLCIYRGFIWALNSVSIILKVFAACAIRVMLMGALSLSFILLNNFLL